MSKVVYESGTAWKTAQPVKCLGQLSRKCKGTCPKYAQCLELATGQRIQLDERDCDVGKELEQ
jgi:hypothetical protein